MRIRRKIDDVESWNIGVVSSNSKHLSRISHVRSSKLFYFVIICFVILGILFVRTLYLQVVYGEKLSEWSDNNHLRVFTIPAPRGLVYDRVGEQLVTNISENIVYMIPADVPKDKQKRYDFFSQVSQILEISSNILEKKIEEKKFSFLPLEIISGVSHETVVTLEESFKESTAIFVSHKSTREYVDDKLYSHLLGYIAPIVEEKLDYFLEKGYTRDEKIGVTGIEKQYEDILRGLPSKRIIEINSRGNIVHERTYSKGKNGAPLNLTIIHELQKYTNDFVSSRLKNTGRKAAVVIVGNPKNGEIYAAVSLPTFDHNMFGDGIKGDEIEVYNEYLNDKYRPLMNRMVGGLYPPGSTFKIVTASAVLEKGIVDENTLIDSPGHLVTYDKYDETKKYIHKDWKAEGHGKINIIAALAESSDTFFYTVSGGFEDFEGVGVGEIAKYSNLYMLGKKTGVDLPGELVGVVPTPDWKIDRKGEGWFTGDTYNLSIGQGYLLTTPLQVYAYASILANNGVFVTPHFYKNLEVKKQKLPISDKTIDLVKQGLVEVIHGEDGTAKSLASFPINLAGKTGTAQFNNNQQEHAWFFAYGPYEDPEVCIMVLVEEGGEGSVAAVPIARDILRYFFENKENWGL